MPRQLIPFVATDVSALAKSLRAQLASRSTLPSHVEMLNMLARAAGHRNFQHLRAGAAHHAELEQDADHFAARADDAAVLRAARYFDSERRLRSWPARTSIQNLCLWVIWSRLPRGQVFEERSINNVLRTLHLFGDHAIIRRTMCELGLMVRTADGREYRRIEQPPSPEGAALIRHLGRRRSSDEQERTVRASAAVPMA